MDRSPQEEPLSRPLLVGPKAWKGEPTEPAPAQPTKTRDRENGAGDNDGIDGQGARPVGEGTGVCSPRLQGRLWEAATEHNGGQARRRMSLPRKAMTRGPQQPGVCLKRATPINTRVGL